MKNTYILFLLICLISSKETSAQRSEYIIKDSVFLLGVVRPNKVGISFRQTVYQSPTYYTAFDISEYGYKGKIRESMWVGGDKRFLLRIVSGKLNLYQYKNKFILKEDSSKIIPLNKRNYQQLLQDVIPFEGIDKILSKIALTRPSLKYLINSYNRGNLEVTNFPYRKIGVSISYNFLYTRANFNKELIFRDRLFTPALGIFIDVPNYANKKLSFMGELNLIAGKPEFYTFKSNASNYLGLRIVGISALLNAKLLLSAKRAYLSAGPSISFLNITSSTGLIQTTVNGSVVEITRMDITRCNSLAIGLNSTIGREISLGGRKIIDVGLRYQNIFGGNFDFFKMSYSGFSIVMAYSF